MCHERNYICRRHTGTPLNGLIYYIIVLRRRLRSPVGENFYEVVANVLRSICFCFITLTCCLLLFSQTIRSLPVTLSSARTPTLTQRPPGTEVGHVKRQETTNPAYVWHRYTNLHVCDGPSVERRRKIDLFTIKKKCYELCKLTLIIFFLFTWRVETWKFRPVQIGQKLPFFLLLLLLLVSFPSGRDAQNTHKQSHNYYPDCGLWLIEYH